ncbi:hypothetical protein RRG08_020637 [Elysia crispata]|uniref:Uncharacterized protein n=1 Tax=Elysia crispata TaxID=231223 RepID=A0AAE1DVR8_9GAST|nr:hypothetical protein RRG08_020637 [Elysia crispata]
MESFLIPILFDIFYNLLLPPDSPQHYSFDLPHGSWVGLIALVSNTLTGVLYDFSTGFKYLNWCPLGFQQLLFPDSQWD